MPKVNKMWDDQEIEFLKSHYHTTTNLHVKLGRSKQSVSYKAFSLGLKANSRGATDINPYYFDKWTPNMAYILGLLSADGNLFKVKGKNSYRITLTQYNKELLEQIAQEMEFKGNIKYTVVKNSGNNGALVSNKSEFHRYDLVISNKYMFDRLVSLGLHPNKSLGLGKMKVPQEYFRYFLRGYIDGDGSISYSRDKRKNRPYYSLEVTILGSYNFLKWIQSRIHKFVGLPKRKPDDKTDSQIKQIRYRGSIAIPFCEWLYDKEATICVDKKKQNFEEFLKLDSEFGPYHRYNMPCDFDLSKLKI